MDYLDPQKESRHSVLLFTGYIFVTIAIVLTALILFYQSFGFGVTRDGSVIQNGLAFFSSQPAGSQIFMNGQEKGRTNTRLVVPSGEYRVEIRREGYRTWAHDIVINEGGVQHYDYPFLVPETLTSNKVDEFDAAPPLATQSLNRRWLLVQEAGKIRDFLIYDLESPEEAAVPLVIPETLLTEPGAESQRFTLVEWADNNEHVLLKRSYGIETEYILLNRENPVESLNLTTLFNLAAGDLTLHDKKYDKYLVFNKEAATLSSATLRNPELQLELEGVISFKSYRDNTYLYATTDGSPEGSVSIRIKANDRTSTLRTFAAGGTYLLEYATYSRVPYAIMANVNDNKVYVYRDPLAQLRKEPLRAIVPQAVLRINSPQRVVFSTNAQFVSVFNGGKVALHDIETKRDYSYDLALPLDAGSEPRWMDGHRLAYVSEGKQVFVEFDNANPRQLVSSLPGYSPFFSPDYELLFTFAPDPRTQNVLLNRTSLLTTQ